MTQNLFNLPMLQEQALTRKAPVLLNFFSSGVLMASFFTPLFTPSSVVEKKNFMMLNKLWSCLYKRSLNENIQELAVSTTKVQQICELAVCTEVQ